MCTHLATWHYPVGDGQEGQTYGDPQHCPALHTDRLLPQTRQVLVPDGEQLLLAVGMGNKLKTTRDSDQCRIRKEGGKVEREEKKIKKHLANISIKTQ